jgi:hypothetical protein
MALGACIMQLCGGLRGAGLSMTLPTIRIFVKGLGQIAAGTKTAVYAWALMTNHAPILLRSSEMGLSGIMRRMQNRSLCCSAISKIMRRTPH